MPDLNELSDDALEAMLKDPSTIPDDAEPEPTPEPEPTSEPAVASEQPAEPESVAEPEVPEPEPEEDFERARLKIVIEELEARQKAMDSKMGRFAGEADYWRKKAEATRSEPASDTEPEYEAETITPEPRAPQTPRRDGVVAWAVNQAITAGISQFEAEHPESAELQTEILEYVKTSGYDLNRLKDSDDPLAAQQEAQRLLGEAFWHARAAKSSQMRAAMDQKRTEQFSRQKEAKQRASTSGSGSSSAPTPKPKSLNELSDAELDAEMRRLSAR